MNTRLVCDASAIIALLLDAGPHGQWVSEAISDAELTAPSLLAFECSNIIRRHELASGRETPWTEVAPAQPGGIRLSQIYITPDGRYWLHGYSRLLTDLYVAEGLR